MNNDEKINDEDNKISQGTQLKILTAIKKACEVLEELKYWIFRNYFLKKNETPRASSIIRIVPVVMFLPAFKL